MLTDPFVFTILGASLSGAGLVLAIYALITPISGKMFERRASELVENIKLMKSNLDKIDVATSTEALERIEKSISEIKEKVKLPSYLGIGVGISFVGFILSCLMSVWWYLGWEFSTMDAWLPFVFGGSIIMFGFVGYETVKEIYEILKLEYQTKKELIDEINKKKQDISVILGNKRL